MHLTYRGAETTGRSRKPLSLRGGAAHTFGNILAFLSVVLSAIGAYELTEVIAHPLEGHSTEIIGAAVLIALAAIMVFYLINPRAHARSRRRRHDARAEVSRAAPLQLPLARVQRRLPFEPPRAMQSAAAPQPPFEFTLRLLESPRDSALPEAGGDAVHGRR